LIFALTACSPKANHEAEKAKESVKRGFEKAKNSPATKELENDVKSGFHKADAVVTKELEKGREKVREGARDLKRKADEH
jgi:hypothetical protein